MQKLHTRLMQTALALIFLFFSLYGIIGGVYCAPAYATSSPVLDDLRTDSAFDVMQYPTKPKDGSLNVIQVAESTDGELLIYVYQPSGRVADLRATSINIAREISNTVNMSFNNYPLTFLNANGVFYKYKVEKFELRKEAIRYYNVSNILRPFNAMFDGELENGNTINEVKNVVGQLWTACTVGDDITYTMRTTETIDITDMYVGYVEYKDGVQLGWGVTGGVTLGNFVAFNTDKPIDKLMQATVTFCENDVTAKYCLNPLHTNHAYGKFNDFEYGEKVQHDPVKVNSNELAGNTGGGMTGLGVYADKYTWNRIQRTSDFIKDQNNKDYKLTTEGVKDISGSQWVLNFYETTYRIKGNDGSMILVTNPLLAAFSDDFEAKTTYVSDVMILQLMFETNGETYNLGAVSNKQTGDGISDNEFRGETVASWVWIALAGLAAVVVIVVLVLLSVYVPGFAQGLGKFALGVVTLPVNIVKGIANAAQTQKAAAPATAPKTKKAPAKAAHKKAAPRRTGKSPKRRSSTSHKKSTGTKRKK